MRRFSYFLILTFIIFSSSCVKQTIETSTTEINIDKTIQKEHYTKSLNIIKNLLNRKNIENYIENLEYVLRKTLYESKLHMSEDEFDNLRNNAIEEANKLIKKYDYKGAAEVLEPIKNLMIEDDPTFIALYDTCVEFSKTVLYEGPVEHIFFHPLIAYPELAFDGDSLIGFFDQPSEFTASNIKVIDEHCKKTGGYCYIPKDTLKQIKHKTERFKSNTEFAEDMKKFTKTGSI